MFKATLTMKKPTENKIVFGQLVNVESFETSVVPSLYIDKRDLAILGVTAELPRLEITLKAVPAS